MRGLRPHQAVALDEFLQGRRPGGSFRVQWNRRTGKTVFAARAMLLSAFEIPGRYAYVGNTESHVAAARQCFEEDLEMRPQTRGLLELANGSRVDLLTERASVPLIGDRRLTGLVLDECSGLPRDALRSIMFLDCWTIRVG